MHERRLGHALVVGLVVGSAFLSMEGPHVQAAEPATPTPRATPQPFTGWPDRGSGSSRVEYPPRFVTPTPTPTPSPTPLPTPVPPTGTPFAYVFTPVPSPTPPPPPPAPAPTPPPSAPTSSYLAWPLGGGISQFYSAGHPAIDITAPCGSPVVAARGGTVVWAGWKTNGGGYVVDIDHGDGNITSYNHLSAVTAVVNTPVVSLQPIGLVGMTGNATGCHLHFAMLANGSWVNPLAYL